MSEEIKKKSNRGRKGKYETHVKPYFEDIKHWLRDGLLEAEVCKRLGISVSIFNDYKLKYLELLELLKESKQQADYKVEDALYKRALGYDVDEVTRELLPKRDPKTGEIMKDEYGLPIYELQVTKVVTKHIQPDVNADKFWLINRQQEKWRDRQEQDINIKGVQKLEDFF